MDNLPGLAVIPGSLVSLLSSAGHLNGAGAIAGPQLADVSYSGFTVALIDCNRFSQECLCKAFTDSSPGRLMQPYATVAELAKAGQADVGLILYYSHVVDVLQPLDITNVAELKRLYPMVPLVVLSDASDSQHPKVVRRLLDAGALGVIPTRTTGLSMSLAVIQFVHAGGTFVPPDLLLAPAQEQAALPTSKGELGRLTGRQRSVLAHLNRGHANKTIAYELGMSESTVKVHVRNIMRKMNATNRTQAVYKARKLWGGDQIAPEAEA